MSKARRQRSRPKSPSKTADNRSIWTQAWNQGTLGWDGPAVDNAMRRAYPWLRSRGLARTASVFVPLCGHSRILKFFYSRGHQVCGLDFVADALRALRVRSFKGLKFRRIEARGRQELEAARLRLVLQDVFTFTEDNGFDLIYDRAAIIAINPARRRAYARVLTRTLKPGGWLFITGFTSYGGRLAGPPFPVSESALRKLFPASKFLLRAKGNRRIRRVESRFRVQGVRSFRYFHLVLQKRL